MDNGDSSSQPNFSKDNSQYSEEITMYLYQSVKMNLQDVLKGAREIDTNFKNLEKDILRTASLINAISEKSALDEE